MKWNRTAVSEWGSIVNGTNTLCTWVVTAVAGVIWLGSHRSLVIGSFLILSAVVAVLASILLCFNRALPISTAENSYEKNFFSLPSASQQRKQSEVLVLEVEGSKPLDTNPEEWRLFVTNCTSQIKRYVNLGPVRSDIGAYEIWFNEIPVMQPGQKVQLSYRVIPRRDIDRDKGANLWDFALDHSGEGGSRYLWYDILVQYRDEGSSQPRDGGLLGICFDIMNTRLKTEGAEYFRNERQRWQRLCATS